MNYLPKKDRDRQKGPPEQTRAPKQCPEHVCRGKDYIAEQAQVREISRCTTIRGNVYVVAATTTVSATARAPLFACRWQSASSSPVRVLRWAISGTWA